MAYDEALAERVRDLVAGRGLTEKKMFGGVSFLLDGNMACGVYKASLLVRLPPDETGKALAEKGARPFDMSPRRPQPKGWVLVDIGPDIDVASWVSRGIAYAETLPPK
jgi:hypothetical protein